MKVVNGRLFPLFLWSSRIISPIRSSPLNNIDPISSSRNLVTSCSSSRDCDGTSEYYCADGQCTMIGECQIDIDCFNPENSFAVIACVGYMECLDGSCSKICSDSNCKPDEIEVQCFADPCDVSHTTPTPASKYCVSNYCDGCNAIYYDEKGTQVYNTCTKDADCYYSDGDIISNTLVATGKDNPPYCAGGICLNAGVCKTDLDCINPSNHYPVKECAGYVECQQQDKKTGSMGMCNTVCGGGSLCKNGQEYGFNCLIDPCQFIPCESSAACASDYCGGCNAILFDAAGNEFFCPEETISCRNDDDCSDDEYCASSGQCKDAAKSSKKEKSKSKKQQKRKKSNKNW